MRVIDAILHLAAELPDPGAPTFPRISAGYGGFVAGLVAWRRRRPEDEAKRSWNARRVPTGPVRARRHVTILRGALGDVGPAHIRKINVRDAGVVAETVQRLVAGDTDRAAKLDLVRVRENVHEAIAGRYRRPVEPLVAIAVHARTLGANVTGE